MIEKEVVVATIDGKHLTEKIADELIETYDPTLHEAPNCIGHPKDDYPAFGWVEKVFKKGKELIARSSLLPELVEMVKKGLFKKRSIAWYLPNHPDNPLPGKMYLAHVGWLGAAPPAIKGMPDVNFSENDGDLTIVEFSETDQNHDEDSKLTDDDKNFGLSEEDVKKYGSMNEFNFSS